MSVKQKPKKGNYIDNQKFYEALLERRPLVLAAIAEGKPKPQASDFIGKCILLICEQMATRYNFTNYSYIEEMYCKGVEDCIAGIDYFNPEKYDKPFAYFSRIAWRAFVRVIQEEKKQQYVKHKHMVEQGYQTMLLDESIDNHQMNIVSDDLEVSSQIISKFENDINTKKKEKIIKEKKDKSLSQFMDEDDA